MLKNLIPVLFIFAFGACVENNSAKTTQQVEQDTNKVLQDSKPITNTQDAPALIDILNTSDNFSLFTSYFNTSISEMLATGEYTVLAPNNQAIESLGEAQMAKMLQKGDSFVKNHIVKGKFDVAALKNTSEITTMQGKKLQVSVQGDNITIGGIRVVVANIYAKNGVIHAIEKVID